MAEAFPRSRGRSSPRNRASLKAVLAVVGLLAVVGVVSFSIVERWLSDPSGEDAGAVSGAGRVVIGGARQGTTTGGRAGPAGEQNPAYKSQEFSFYKSLGGGEPAPPKLDPPRRTVPPAARPTEAVSPVERPRASGRPSYTVQVGSFQDRGSADRLAAKVRRFRYTVTVVRAVLPDSGVRYRVRVGTFATREDALKAADIMKRTDRSIEPFVAAVASSQS